MWGSATPLRCPGPHMEWWGGLDQGTGKWRNSLIFRPDDGRATDNAKQWAMLLAYRNNSTNDSTSDNLGYLGVTTVADCILEGTYVCPPEVDQCTREFIKSLQITSPIHPKQRIGCSITKKDSITYWKGFRECTSSSISGLHVGHWKMVADKDYLAKTHALFTELVVLTCFSPSRWQWGLSVMLKKVAGCHDPACLWAILLMEADFNFCIFCQMNDEMGRRPQQNSRQVLW